jgi:Ser/Thr protein kinase RdoA (MazF antagonist)
MDRAIFDRRPNPQERLAKRTKPFEALAQEARLTCFGEVAAEALRLYDVGDPAEPALINISENATYRIEDKASGRRWALRVHREGYHSETAIESELAWLTALRNDGVAITPVPVAGYDGALIQHVSHPAMARPRNVVLFEWEEGREPSEGDALFEKFEILGAVAARMHLHSLDWKRPLWFERHVWNFETSLGDRPHWGGWRDGLGTDKRNETLFGRTVDLIRRRLARFGDGAERFGLTHSDMRLANLLVHGEQVKVIDFDDCGFSWHLYDAATAVSFFEHDSRVPELMHAWTKGYRSVRALSAADEAEIPTFVMLRRMLLVAWIGSHSDTGLAQSKGASYTEMTAPMCEAYLTRFG